MTDTATQPTIEALRAEHATSLKFYVDLADDWKVRSERAEKALILTLDALEEFTNDEAVMSLCDSESQSKIKSEMVKLKTFKQALAEGGGG